MAGSNETRGAGPSQSLQLSSSIHHIPLQGKSKALGSESNRRAAYERNWLRAIYKAKRKPTFLNSRKPCSHKRPLIGSVWGNICSIPTRLLRHHVLPKARGHQAKGPSARSRLVPLSGAHTLLPRISWALSGSLRGSGFVITSSEAFESYRSLVWKSLHSFSDP